MPAAGDCVARWRSIAALWPRHSKAPAYRTMPFPELEAALAAPDALRRLGESSPLLIAVDGDHLA